MRRPSLPLLLLVAGCGGPAAPPAAPTATDPPKGSPTSPSAPAAAADPCSTYDCSNPIDAVVVRMLATNGLPVTREDDAVLCRRLAVDLDGITPTPDEIANQCVGKTPAQMAAYFMNKPSAAHVPDGSAPYVWVNRRSWADSFQYDSSTDPKSTWYSYVRALDGLVADLYGGRIGYDVFVAKALASPAFLRRFGVFEANHDLVQIASQSYRVFLGREALPSEAEDFGNLFRGFTTSLMSEQAAEIAYPDCPVTYDNTNKRNGCAHYEVGLQGSQCAGAALASCQTSLMGGAQVVPSQTAFVRYDDLSAADLDAIETPGRLIAAQPEFAEAAVDRALTRYLGWWKAGWYRPDFDVPKVRDALVARFVASGFDLRQLETTIVTSVLYTQRAALTENQNPLTPIWAFGPTKMLYAEAWLDTVGQAVGKRVGGCDFRYQSTKIAGSFTWPASLGSAFYAPVARNMGGCPIASTHGDASGLVPAITRRSALAQLCPGAIKPQASWSTLDAIIDTAYAGLGRPAQDDERAILKAHMTVVADGGLDAQSVASIPACVAEAKPDTNCQLLLKVAQTLSDGLCISLYASAPFTYY